MKRGTCLGLCAMGAVAMLPQSAPAQMGDGATSTVFSAGCRSGLESTGTLSALVSLEAGVSPTPEGDIADPFGFVRSSPDRWRVSSELQAPAPAGACAPGQREGQAEQG
jgi:hypothetical protein